MTDGAGLLAHFLAELRRTGIRVPPDTAATYAKAAGLLAPVGVADLYWAGRTTLVKDPLDLPAYDRVFVAWVTGWVELADDRTGHDEWIGEGGGDGPDPGRGDEATSRPAGAGAAAEHSAATADVAVDLRPEGGSGPDDEHVGSGAAASEVEVLRTRRFAEATDAELHAMRRLMRTMVLDLPRRRTRRWSSADRGRRVDPRRSLRQAIRTDGEVVRWAGRARRWRRRPLVLVLDVSGSMAGYSRALMQFAFSAQVAAPDVEVFCFGTRLTRVTPDIDQSDVDSSLRAAAARVADWDGGTSIGGSLATLNRDFGRGSTLRGAVVTICSDGLDRGDPLVLGREMARLARYAHSVIWVNPLKGDARYEPLAQGMAAALPHIDHFVSGHDLASLEALAGVISDSR